MRDAASPKKLSDELDVEEAIINLLAEGEEIHAGRALERLVYVAAGICAMGSDPAALAKEFDLNLRKLVEGAHDLGLVGSGEHQRRLN